MDGRLSRRGSGFPDCFPQYPAMARRKSLSGNDVGKQLALDLQNQILEHQLAFLQALKLKLVEGDLFVDPCNDIVQVAMFFKKLRELLPHFLSINVLHGFHEY
jgi:hypothetical protein